MSSTLKPKTSPDIGGGYVGFEEYIQFQLHQARRGIRGADLLTGAVGVVLLTAGYLFLFVVTDHWLISGGWGALARYIWWSIFVATVGGWIWGRVIRPWSRRVTALYAAAQLEQSHPELKSNLLTLVDLRQAGRPVSPVIIEAMERRAALDLQQVSVDDAIDRRLLTRMSYILLAMVVVLSIYTLTSPKSLITSAWRALFPMVNVSPVTRTTILDVKPGDLTVFAHATPDIETTLGGTIPDVVRVLYTTEDRSLVDEPIQLQDTGEGIRRFRGRLTGERGDGLIQNGTYRVVAGDAVSDTYSISVRQPPTANVEEVFYDYPPYMGLDDRTQADSSVDAWEGTVVRVRALANMPVDQAIVLFSDTDEVGTVKAEEIPMQIVDGVNLTAQWQLKFRSDGTFPRFYRIKLARRSESGEEPVIVPTFHSHRVREDLPPKLEILHPTEDMERPSNATVPIAYEASDPDFLLKSVTLKFEKDGELLSRQHLLFDAPPFEQKTRGQYALALESFNLEPGKSVTLWLEARDNFEPFADQLHNITRSPKITITATEPVNPEQAQKEFENQAQAAEQALDAARQKDHGEEEPQTPAESDEPPNNDPPTDPMSPDQPQEPGESGEQPAEDSGDGQSAGGNADPADDASSDGMPENGDENPSPDREHPAEQQASPESEAGDKPMNGDNADGGADPQSTPNSGSPSKTSPRPAEGGAGKSPPSSAGQTQRQPRSDPTKGTPSETQPKAPSSENQPDAGETGSPTDPAGNPKGSGSRKTESNNSQNPTRPTGQKPRQDKAAPDEALEKLIDRQKKKGGSSQELAQGSESEPREPKSNRSNGNAGDKRADGSTTGENSEVKQPNPNDTAGDDRSDQTDESDSGTNRTEDPKTSSKTSKSDQPTNNDGESSSNPRTKPPASSNGPNRKESTGRDQPRPETKGKNTPQAQKPTESAMSNDDSAKPDGEKGASETESPPMTTGNDSESVDSSDPSDMSNPSTPQDTADPAQRTKPSMGSNDSPPDSAPSPDSPMTEGSEKGRPSPGGDDQDSAPDAAGEDAADPATKSPADSGEMPDAGSGESMPQEPSDSGKTEESTPQGTPDMPSPPEGEPQDTAQPSPAQGTSADAPSETPEGETPEGQDRGPGKEMKGGSSDPKEPRNEQNGREQQDGGRSGQGASNKKPQPSKEESTPGANQTPGADPAQKNKGDDRQGKSPPNRQQQRSPEGAGKSSSQDATQSPSEQDSPESPAGSNNRQGGSPSESGASSESGEGESGESGGSGQAGAGDASQNEGMPNGSKGAQGGKGGKPSQSQKGNSGDSSKADGGDGQGTPSEAGADAGTTEPMNDDSANGGQPGPVDQPNGENEAGSGQKRPGSNQGKRKQPSGDKGSPQPDTDPEQADGPSDETSSSGSSGASNGGGAQQGASGEPGESDVPEESDPSDSNNTPHPSSGKKPPQGASQKNGAQKDGGQKKGAENNSPSSPSGGQEGGGAGSTGGEGEQGSGGSSGTTASQGTGATGPGAVNGGLQGGSNPEDSQVAEAPEGPGHGDEKANQEHRKRAAALALQQLKDELSRGESPDDLLKELGWTDDDLDTFMKQLDENLNSADDASSPEAQARRRQFDELLKGVDLDAAGELKAGGDQPRAASQSSGSNRRATPRKYESAEEAFRRRMQKGK